MLTPLEDGFRNSAFVVNLNYPPQKAVVRIQRQDVSLCRKEADLLRLVRDRVPVPEVLFCDPPYLVLPFIEGISFRELARRGDAETSAQAAFSIGQALAAIHSLDAPLAPRPVDPSLDSPVLLERLPPELHEPVRQRLLTLVDPCPPRLVHGDFNKRNVLVHPIDGRWQVSAVLDWEFALTGSPLMDIGTFLRYERDSRPRAEPYFSQGYRSAGGTLPQDWRFHSKTVDLAALCASLADPDLPPDITTELLELVQAY